MTPTRRIAAIVAAFAALGAAPAAATAAAPAASGSSTFELRGPIAAALGHTSVTAKLAVTDGALGTTTDLAHRRTLVLGRARLTSVRVQVAAGTTVSALVGGKRVTLFTLRDRPSVNADTGLVRLTSGALRLTSAGAKALAARLGVKKLAVGPAGTLTVRAELPDAEPPVLARPKTAVAVKTAAITWHVRESFVRYINTGEGLRASNGATAGPATTTAESNTSLVYDFGFAFVQGWFDPASGRAWLSFRGTVTFSYLGHGIDLDAKNPEIELTGSASRAIFRFDGRHDTQPGNRRGVLAQLQPDKAVTTIVAGTRTYAQIPATIPKEAASSVFAGYYLPGAAFGSFAVSLTTA
ncbi:MAG TPA: HtaA domain-containing protein [Solirubrobacteraceae bacterium]|nr:HtaA domain-containing protein [Solirubrobacteraceae bacterium]